MITQFRQRVSSFLILFTCFSLHVSVAQSVSGQRIVIKYAPELSPKQKQGISQKLGVESSIRRDIALQTLAKGQSVQAFRNSSTVQTYLHSGEIIGIEPDIPFDLSTIPNDPAFGQQWGLDNTGQSGGSVDADAHLVEAWNLQTQGSGILGLIDTGIDFTHPDLIDNIWQNLAEDADGDGHVLEFLNGQWQLDPGDLDSIDADNNGYIDDLIGWDFVHDDNNPYDDNGHGTHVGGIIGASGNNGIGISGVAWQTQIMPLKAFDRWGNAYLSDILPALAYAREMGVLVTNNSWGGQQYSEFLYEEIRAARDLGQVFVAASGNSGYNDPAIRTYPASYDLENIISVASSDDKDELSGFSSYSRQTVDLAAPGDDIYSTLPLGQYGKKSGTSMAAGFVSGAVLLLHAYDPSLNATQMIDRILANVDYRSSLYGMTRTGGRLNVFNLLNNTANQTSNSSLIASFHSETSSCEGSSISFSNHSSMPNYAQTSFQWHINDSLVASTEDLDYTFDEAGWYEVRLTITDPNDSQEIFRPIEITPTVTADLGQDTSLCASAYVMYAGTDINQVRWSRLYCNDVASCASDGIFTTLDSIQFVQNGSTDGFEDHFVLTDDQDQIVAVSEELTFAPQDSSGTYRLYGIYHWSWITPSGMLLGNPISAIDLGPDTCGQINLPHEFQVVRKELLGDEPFVTIRESGIYVLEVEDICGNIATDTIDISLTGDCVWPGDVNVDGKVSMIDFLSLGIANGQSGLTRSNPSLDWIGQASPDWASEFDSANVLAPAINHKHADCDGDGLVSLLSDKQAIKNNLGFFHQIDVPAGDGSPSFHIQYHNTLFSADGDTAIIQIGMYLYGADSTDVEDLYGIAFNLNFSDPVAVEPQLSPSEDWLEPMETLALFTDGSQSSFGAQFLPSTRKKIGFGMVSSSEKSSKGKGLLADGVIIVTIDEIADDPSATAFSSFSISSEHIILVDSLGRPVSTQAASSLNTITVEIEWPEQQTPFPVEWMDFRVSQEEEDAILTWETRSELNADFFDLQRSIDGQMFSKIGQIEATGNSQQAQSYQYTDPDIASLSSPRLFYRLRQVDLDGQFSYSKTVSLQLAEKQSDRISAYPNPFVDILTLEYRTRHSASARIRITTGLGQVLQEMTHLDAQGSIELSTTDWASGVYFISLETEAGKQVRKVFKD